MLNSLLYWLIDLAYKVMLEGEEIKPWDPEPFILRRPGVEARMVDELMRMGHLLQLLYRSEHVAAHRGDALLLEVKEVETTATLLASIRAECAESCPMVVGEYDELMRSPALTLERLERLEFEALVRCGWLEPHGRRRDPSPMTSPMTSPMILRHGHG